MTSVADHSLRTQEIIGAADNYNRWIFQTLRPYLGRRILDVGCSIGNITRFYASRERVVGVDLSGEAVARIRRRFAPLPGFSACVADLGDPDFPRALAGERFDTIVCLNVLEHIEDDAAALRRFAALLEPEGRLLLLVPALRPLYGSMDAADGHFRRYEAPSLRRALSAGGFEPLKMFYFNFVGVFGWFLNGRILKKTYVPEDQLRWFDRLVPLLRRWEEGLRPALGQSLFAVARSKRSEVRGSPVAVPSRASLEGAPRPRAPGPHLGTVRPLGGLPIGPSCPLCRQDSGRPHHDEAGCRYYRCARCGFVYLFPRPSVEELHRLYQEEAGATFHHGAEIREAFEKDLEARYRLAVAGPALRQAPVRSALEIGCGAGFLLARLRRMGWEVAGTEMSEDYLRFARTLGLEVGTEAPSRSFGAVLLFNVLSHLADPEEDLRAFGRRLFPGGVLVLETGNAAEVPPSRVGPHGAPEHLWHFSERNLRNLLGELGFRDVRVQRRNVEWQRGLLSLAGGLRRRRKGGGSSSAPRVRPRPPRAWASRLLLGLRFHAGRFLADRAHFCTLFVTARKG